MCSQEIIKKKNKIKKKNIYIIEISDTGDTDAVDIITLKIFSAHTNTHAQVIAAAEAYSPLTHNCVLFHMRKRENREVEYL